MNDVFAKLQRVTVQRHIQNWHKQKALSLWFYFHGTFHLTSTRQWTFQHQLTYNEIRLLKHNKNLMRVWYTFQ